MVEQSKMKQIKHDFESFRTSQKSKFLPKFLKEKLLFLNLYQLMEAKTKHEVYNMSSGK